MVYSLSGMLGELRAKSLKLLRGVGRNVQRTIKVIPIIIDIPIIAINNRISRHALLSGVMEREIHRTSVHHKTNERERLNMCFAQSTFLLNMSDNGHLTT